MDPAEQLYDESSKNLLGAISSLETALRSFTGPSLTGESASELRVFPQTRERLEQELGLAAPAQKCQTGAPAQAPARRRRPPG